MHAAFGIAVSSGTVLILLVVFTVFPVFSGNTGEALGILGVLVQSSSAVFAILFAFLFFITETIIGKYIPKTIDLLLKQRRIITIFTFYMFATLVFSLAMWFFPIDQLRIWVDVSISLFVLEIALLLILFPFLSNLLNPKMITMEILSEADFTNEKTVKESMEKIRLVFSNILKLAKNEESDSAIHGLKSITELVTSDVGNNLGLGFYLWLIPQYERIGVECFQIDPNISEAVVSQFDGLVDHLNKKTAFVLSNVCSRITASCFRISSIIAEKPYAEITLARSCHLLQKIYISKVIVEYGFSAFEELKRIIQLIKLMQDANVPRHWMMGFDLLFSCEKLVKHKKFEELQSLFHATLNVFPKDDITLQTYANIIISVIPLDKKEIALDLIQEIKTKFGHVSVQLDKDIEPSRREVGARNGIIMIKSSNKEIAEKVEWFQEAF